MGSLTFTIAPSTVLIASKTLVSKNLKDAPCDKILMLSLSCVVNFRTDVYPSINFLAFVTLKLKLSFTPSKHNALKHIAISKA